MTNPPTAAEVLTLDTPHGPARAHLHHAGEPRGALMLGHGAGGSVTAPDLTAVTKAAVAANVTVALIEQPYRVAGRKSAAPAKQLDAAWLAVAEHLQHAELEGLGLVTGGRSSGARVACRTAEATSARGVLCLAFPLHPPQRTPDAERKTRLPELEEAGVPVLVVQGKNDRFGIPPEGPDRTVTVVDGDHGLKKDLDLVAAAATAFLDRVL